MDTNNKNSEIDITDYFVAPWGLAKETRPLHVMWEGDPEYIQLGFTEPIEVADIYNAVGNPQEYEKEETKDKDFAIYQIPNEDLETEGYLSAEFSITQIFDNVMVGQKVSVAFINNGERIKEAEDYTFTIRPKIRCLEAPNSISPDIDESIGIKMEYIGFGMAEVKIEAEASGEIVSEKDSIYKDIVDALIETRIHEKESESFEKNFEEWKEESGFDKENHKEFVSELREKLQNGDIFDKHDDKEIQTLVNILEEGDSNEDVLGVSNAVELLLMNSIIDMVDRHPAEKIQLDSPNTKIDIDSEVTAVDVIYHLRDVEGNRYDSTTVHIDIEESSTAGFEFSRDINTEWETLRLDPDSKREEAIERMEEEI